MWFHIATFVTAAAAVAVTAATWAAPPVVVAAKLAADADAAVLPQESTRQSFSRWESSGSRQLQQSLYDINSTDSNPRNSTSSDGANNETLNDSSQESNKEIEVAFDGCSVILTPDDVAIPRMEHPGWFDKNGSIKNSFTHDPVCGSDSSTSDTMDGGTSGTATNNSTEIMTATLPTLTIITPHWHDVDAYGTLCTCNELNVTETCTNGSTTALGHRATSDDDNFWTTLEHLYGGRSYSYHCVNQFPTCLDPDYVERRNWYYRRGILESQRSSALARTTTTNNANDDPSMNHTNRTIRIDTYMQMCFTYTNDAVDPDDRDIGDGSGRLCWSLDSADADDSDAGALGEPCHIDYNGVPCHSCTDFPTSVERTQGAPAGTAPLYVDCFRANCTNIRTDAMLDNCPGMVIDAEKNTIIFDMSIADDNDRKGFVGPFRVLKNFKAPYEWKSCNASTPSSGVTMATAASWWIDSDGSTSFVWHIVAVISATVLVMW